MVLRVCQYLLSLRAVRVEVGVGGVDTIPMVTVQNTVVIVALIFLGFTFYNSHQQKKYQEQLMAYNAEQA